MTKREKQMMAALKRASREVLQSRKDREMRRFVRILKSGKNPTSFKL